LIDGRGDDRYRGRHLDWAIVGREGSPDRCQDLFLDLRRRDAGDRPGVLPAALQQRSGDVVSPAPSAFGRVARTHPVSAIVIEFSGKERLRVGIGNSSHLRLSRKMGLDAIADLPVDDRPVQAVVDLSLVPEPSDLPPARPSISLALVPGAREFQ